MQAKIKPIFAPPVFDDDDKTRVAGLLNIILLATLLISIVAGILFVATNTQNLVAPLVVVGLVILTALSLLALMRRGHVKLASLLFCLAVWLITSQTGLAVGSLRAPIINGFFPVVIMAGLLLGARAALVFAGLSILSGLGILIIETSGFGPALDAAISPVSAWLTMTRNLIVVSGLLYLAIRSLNEALEATRRNERALTAEMRARERTQKELRKYKESLKVLVKERTRELMAANEQLREAKDVADKARTEAEHASQTKSAFLANMSHELRTPLNAIIGYSELLQEELIDLGDKSLLPDLERIHNASTHLQTLVNDVLDLAKIEAGKMDVYLEKIHIEELVNDVEQTVAPLVEQQKNVLTVHYADGIGQIYTDVTKVRQILINLLSNAAKFTHAGQITLSVAHESKGKDDWIIFKVADNGIGMSSEHLNRLFEAFSQADVSTAKEYGGTGLGLAISQHYCRMMGGEISVESELGLGTTFTARLLSR